MDAKYPEMPECVRAMMIHFMAVMRGFEERGVKFKDGVENIPTILEVRKYYGEVKDGKV